jgi:hypothetical protein
MPSFQRIGNFTDKQHRVQRMQRAVKKNFPWVVVNTTQAAPVLATMPAKASTSN